MTIGGWWALCLSESGPSPRSVTWTSVFGTVSGRISRLLLANLLSFRPKPSPALLCGLESDWPLDEGENPGTSVAGTFNLSMERSGGRSEKDMTLVLLVSGGDRPLGSSGARTSKLGRPDGGCFSLVALYPEMMDNSPTESSVLAPKTNSPDVMCPGSPVMGAIW